MSNELPVNHLPVVPCGWNVDPQDPYPLLYSRWAAHALIAAWDKNNPKDYDGPPVSGYPPVTGFEKFLLPWFLLPGLFVVAWVTVLFINRGRP